MDVLELGHTRDGALRAAVATERELVRLEGVKVDHLLAYVTDVCRDWEAPLVEVPGCEELDLIGGVGTPRVPDLALCEVSAAFGMSQPAATSLVADVLDLGFRLPRTLAALRGGTLPMPRARLIARRSRILDQSQAALVDEKLTVAQYGALGWMPLAAKVSWGRFCTLLEQAVLDAQDGDDVDAAAESAARSRYLAIGPVTDGVADVVGRLGAEDAARLDSRLDEVARWLTHAGDDRPRTELRAVAVGYLTDPHLLAQLPIPQHATNGREQPPADPDAGSSAAAASSPAHGEGAADSWSGGIAPEPAGVALRSTVLYLHLDAASQTWCDERTGVLPRSVAQEIVGHSNVTIRPVLDLAETLTYTGYVPAPRLREQIVQRNAGYCTFPSCGRRSRAGDIDHIHPWDASASTAPDARGDLPGDGPPAGSWSAGSPPGGAPPSNSDAQVAGVHPGTTTLNTQGLCRRHHRAKTHGGWRVTQPAPGIWVWRSPADAYYLVTNSTTTPLNAALDMPEPTGSLIDIDRPAGPEPTDLNQTTGQDRERDEWASRRGQHETTWVGPRWLAQQIAAVDPYLRTLD